jgi:hypothetical protein
VVIADVLLTADCDYQWLFCPRSLDLNRRDLRPSPASILNLVRDMRPSSSAIGRLEKDILPRLKREAEAVLEGANVFTVSMQIIPIFHRYNNNMNLDSCS